MRILLVSHPPLEAESGAAQIALNLAAALREHGHDALAWSPEPLEPGARWWNLWLRRRAAIEQFAAAQGPFDVVDVPAISASSGLACQGRLVVRSIQPELLYLLDDLKSQFLGPRPSARAPAHALHGIAIATSILAGWRRAQVILCLGSREREWMRRRFPRWAAKLGCYVCSPSAADRAALAEARRDRGPASGRESTRWLWIGRWSSHKGTANLLAWLRERAASHPGDRLTVAGCGEGAARDWAVGWRRELLASGRVRLLPGFARGELPGLLTAHDAGLFTSLVEGWGLCLNEMLEAGLPVYATEAGATVDLRPFFPGSLRPFPPPAGPPPPADDDPQESGYLRRFAWPAIARSYERQVLAPLSAARDRSTAARAASEAEP